MFSKRFEKKAFKAAVKDNVKTLYRKTIDEATPQQLFQAVSYAVKDVIIDDWIETQKRYDETDAKTVYYMSMEFLMGRALGNNLINMTAYKEVKEALEEMNIDLNVIEDQEPDAALGNGGLGRLAACFLDSLATLNYPAYGCGIRYRYGMFKQKIKDGYQVEVPDNWLKEGNPFEIRREEYAKEVRFGGNIRFEKDPVTGKDKFIQENYESVMAVPYDMPIVGYGNHVVNTLRVWDAKPITDFKLDEFDRGNYHKAVEQENLAKLIVDVLYPNDNHYSGKELRLKQQYFFISASLQALIEKYKKKHGDIRKLHEKVVIQMNDTHPTVAVPELMRLLIDVEGLSWEDAWEVTSKTCAYTNHTIMAEALEKWPIDLFSKLLPRIYQIVQEIDRRFLIKVREMYPGNEEKVRKMAILMNGQVRMANMAIVAGFSVNGVAQLHTEILEKQELKDFYQMMPEKFNNKTNGITFRRWLMSCNPELSAMITDLIGDGWKKDANELEKLGNFVNDDAVLDRLLAVKAGKKADLKNYLKMKQGFDIDENSIYDIQVKRLHEYKRQQMNALYVIHKYFEIKEGKKPATPITVFFGAKAAPAYIIAKDIIHLILCLQQIINNDPEVSPYLKVFMVENYNVTMAEKMIPACDISEQISLASKEASGTGNMKFMLNGAITLGTLDGANVEIAELVGDDNVVIFGMKDNEVNDLKASGSYSSWNEYNNNPNIKKVIDSLVDGTWNTSREEFKIIFDELMARNDEYFLLKDFESYRLAQEKINNLYQDRANWSKICLANIAKSGHFSSDRTIEDYVKDIWHLNRVKI